MGSTSTGKLHDVMWQYIDTWRQDPTGPWWEGDLSLDIGGLLRAKLAQERHVTVKNLPGFLSHWPPNTPFRRLGTENHFRGRGRGDVP